MSGSDDTVEGALVRSPSVSSLGSVSLPSDMEWDSLLEFESEGDDDEDNDENTADVYAFQSTDSGEDAGVESDGEEVPVSKLKKKRKRGGYKKGTFKQRKGARSRSASSARSSSGDRFDNVVDTVEGVLCVELSDGEEGEHALSCPSTLPSEGDRTELDEGVEPVKEKQRKVPGRGKASIGRKKKTHPKSVSQSTMLSGPAEKSEKQEQANLNQDEGANQEKRVKIDVSTSVNFHDILASNIPSSSTSSSNEVLLATTEYLKATLEDCWYVSLSECVIAVCKVASPSNPFVERAVTWNGQKVNFLVHNKQLPAKNIFWQLKKPDPGNIGSVVDFLTASSKMFLLYDICSGIDCYQNQWDTFSESTYLESYESPIMRSNNCSLLRVYPGRCSNCHQIVRKMADHERRKKKDSDKSKVNFKYLDKEDLINRLRKVQKEKKLSKQQVKRLRERINKLLEKKAEKIDSELGNDFVNVMNANCDKMTGIEKIFWEQQSLALSKRDASKTMRWHPSMIRLALQLRMLSPAAYDFMKGVLRLPSQRRLFDYSQFTDVKEGLQQDLLEQFSNTIQEKCPEEYQQYFSLLLDEMSIRSDLVYHARSGELIGFTNLSSVEEELASLESEINGKCHEKKLAKKVLVFMLNGAVSNVRFIPAVYTTDDLSSAQLYSRAWDVIYAVEEAGAKVLTVICDGASVNRKFINMHSNCGKTEFVHATKNVASGESRILFFMLDPPHLIKTFRNCFANSFSHRCTRTLCINNEQISWKVIEVLYDILQSHKFKITKLTKAHVRLSSFSCMKVILAVQVFSKSVASALEQFKDNPALKEFYNEELVNFILKMNRWFDCFNGGVNSKKKAHNPDLKEYTSMEDDRFVFLEKEFLGFLKQWENFVASSGGTKEERSKMIISFQSLEAIRITTCSFIEITKFLLEKKAPSVSSRNFNQDPLEQYFSDQRRVRGSDNNPTASQFLHTRLSIHSVGQMTSGGKRSNTEDLRKMEVDDTPLPTRNKKSKKDS